jgi:hypothetical protein
MPATFTLAGPKSLPPTPWSYWVVEHRLLAGAYPGSLAHRRGGIYHGHVRHRKQLDWQMKKALIDAGLFNQGGTIHWTTVETIR